MVILQLIRAGNSLDKLAIFLASQLIMHLGLARIDMAKGSRLDLGAMIIGMILNGWSTL